jgi:predicted DNA-binding ribbon-helix-helix protein
VLTQVLAIDRPINAKIFKLIFGIEDLLDPIQFCLASNHRDDNNMNTVSQVWRARLLHDTRTADLTTVLPETSWVSPAHDEWNAFIPLNIFDHNLQTMCRSMDLRAPRYARTALINSRDKGTNMKSLVAKRSIVIAGHKTSVSLEDAFWGGLKEIAIARGTSVSNVVSSIDAERPSGNLSSGIRLFVLDFYRNQFNKATATQNAPPALKSVRQTGSLSTAD